MNTAPRTSARFPTRPRLTLPPARTLARARRALGSTVALGRTLALALALAACGTARAPGAATPGPGEPRDPAPRLPPIPRVDGELDLRVSYPRDSAFVATRGRNFIFGSTGTADARLWINGQPVEVRPNGGFLAFLPVPADSVYRLRAEADGRSATLEVPVRIPPAAPSPGDSLAIVPGSPYPAGAWAALPGERVDVGFRGTAGATARILLPDGGAFPLVQRAGNGAAGAAEFVVDPDAAAPAGLATPGEPDLAWYRGFFAARDLVAPDTALPWPILGGDRPDSAAPAILELATGADTVRQPLPLNLVILDPDRPRVGVAFDPDPPAQNGDGAINGRPGPGGGPYHYTWVNGTELTLTGERDGIFRVRLDDALDAWSPAGDIQLLVDGTPPPTSRVATVRMDPQPRWVDVHVALDRRLPYNIEESHDRLTLRVHGAISRVNFLQHGRVDPYIVRAGWSQPRTELFVLDVLTSAAPWGYETFWNDGDDLVLRIRRPPAIDPRHPLRGLTVGVDAGHGGADRATMGPTGLTEADANLEIARALGTLLERAGARAVLTRMTDTTLSLVERTTRARAEDVDLWVSVHNNAFPDGVNPWENNGTSVYYNHPRAASLAWAVQEELLAELGLRDLGVGRADLHQARFTWAPAILTENMFMMIPEQEAALRREDVRRRIAEAHVRGLEEWLRAYALTGRGDPRR